MFINMYILNVLKILVMVLIMIMYTYIVLSKCTYNVIKFFFVNNCLHVCKDISIHIYRYIYAVFTKDYILYLYRNIVYFVI
jgi:hypothetical protein